MKDEILSRLQKVRGSGPQYMACCPAHQDREPSLAVLFNPDGRILMHCNAGCDVNDVLAAIGLSLSDLYPDGAIQDFMRSATPKPKEHKYDAYLDHIQRHRKAGKRVSRQALQDEKYMYLRKRGTNK